jgi:hypothetical protein
MSKLNKFQEQRLDKIINEGICGLGCQAWKAAKKWVKKTAAKYNPFNEGLNKEELVEKILQEMKKEYE